MDYHLPSEFIAKQPASPRDSSRLFIYDTAKDKIYFDRFYNLDKYLPENSFLVLNKTRVAPARLTLFKETGGKVEILLLLNEIQPGDKVIKGLSDRKLLPGQRLFCHPHDFCHSCASRNLFFDHKADPHFPVCLPAGRYGRQAGRGNDILFFVESKNKNIFSFRPNFPMKNLPEILDKYGKTPIPKYIKNSPLAEKDLRKKYQTIFAARSPTMPTGRQNFAQNNQASVAAPTASLHFTNRVFKKLQSQKIPHVFVTLNVGLGTFAPIAEGNFINKKLFSEYYEIEKSAAKKIAEFKNTGNKLVAVGTTTVRTLESVYRCEEPKGRRSNQARLPACLPVGKAGQAGSVVPSVNAEFTLKGSTDLFIFPPYNFQLVDHLITNFHLPKSSLMLLVSAFLQHKNSQRRLTDLYKTAIKNKFRFYSFGDAMLIL